MGSKIGYLGRFQEFKCLEQIISTPNAYWNRPILSNYACIREEVYTLALYRFQNTGLLGVFCLIIVLWEGGGVNTPKLPGFGLGSGN